MSDQQRNALRRLKNLRIEMLWLEHGDDSRFIIPAQIAQDEALAKLVNRQLDKLYGPDAGF